MTTVTYTLVPIPLWYFADGVGRPLGGGYMATWRSIDKVTPKAIYTDSSGTNPWPNPVYFDENGEAPGMFFWANDEAYFIQVFDAQNNLLFTADNYGPGIAGGGGGGSITTFNNLENYVLNNLWLRNQGTLNNIQSGTVISPSNHDGFVKTSTGFATLPYVGPDVMYLRNVDASTDNLVFATADFNAGNVPLTGDVTPEYYVNLTCTVAGGETLKAIQFPIDLHVKNFEQQTMSALIWAKDASGGGSHNLIINLVQYFGTGSATAPVITPLLSTTLTNTWAAYSGNAIVPTISGKTLASVGDDATYLQIVFPLSTTFSISVTKPKLYLGTVGQVFPELQTYDMVDRVINSPRTGDIRTSLNSYAPFGWVAANDGSIGSAGSAATSRKNVDTWPLFALLYTSVLDHWAPVSGGRTGTTIADAASDFAANKTMTLTRNLGRVLAGSNALLTAVSSFSAAAATDLLTIADTTNFPTGTPVQLTTLVGCTPLATNIVYYAIKISGTTLKLANTLDLAYAGTGIDITVDGTGNIQTALGAQIGESTHTQTTAEMPTHNHGLVGAINTTGAAVKFPTLLGSNSGDTAPVSSIVNAGSGTPFNIVQPTTYLNVFYKL